MSPDQAGHYSSAEYLLEHAEKLDERAGVLRGIADASLGASGLANRAELERQLDVTLELARTHAILATVTP